MTAPACPGCVTMGREHCRSLLHLSNEVARIAGELVVDVSRAAASGGCVTAWGLVVETADHALDAARQALAAARAQS